MIMIMIIFSTYAYIHIPDKHALNGLILRDGLASIGASDVYHTLKKDDIRDTKQLHHHINDKISGACKTTHSPLFLFICYAG